MQALSGVFGDRIISRSIWPASSPQLNPRAFFFWGFLKDKFCNINVSKEEVKENVRREITNIPGEELQKVNQIFFSRCEE
jgi:hypothetical protein